MRYAIAAIAVFSVFPVTSKAEESSLFNVDAQQAIEVIENYFRQVDSALAAGDIRVAKQKLSFINFKLQKYKDEIGKDQGKTYNDRMSGQNASVLHIIDSLVKVNLSVLKKSGRQEGIQFRRQLEARGLTEDQLGPVDEAIINASPTEEPSAPPPPPPPLKTETQIESFSHIARYDAPIPELESKPEKTPQPKALSAKQESPPKLPPPPVEKEPEPAAQSPWPESAAPESPALSWPKASEPGSMDRTASPVAEAAVDPGVQKAKVQAQSNATRVTALLTQGKTDEAMSIFQFYRSNMEKFLPMADFAKLQSALDAATAKDQQRRADATRIARSIDDMVDQNHSAEAYDKFQAQRDQLKQYCEKDEFSRLEEKVGRAQLAFGKAQALAHARAREIRTLLMNNVAEALAAFARSQDELKRSLPKDSFEELRKDVAKAETKIRDKQKQSQYCRREIVDLIEKGKGAAAFARFKENKPLLQAYLVDSSYSSLATAVINANNDFYTRQGKAQTELHRIDSLIAAKKIEQARDLFSQRKDTLRYNLNDDKRFFDLKDRVRTAFDEFSKNKKMALRSEKKITSLVQRNKGRDAYLIFLQDAGLLKEFLDAGVYQKLSEAVKNASRDFEAGAIAARKMASGIESLLKQRRFEQAVTTFKATRDTFDHYLEDDPAIEALGKRADSSFTAFRKHKRWATDRVEDIQLYIDEKKGDQARTLYEKVKPELSLYLETIAMKPLDSAVTAGEKSYLAAKTLAEKNVKRLDKLLDQKHFEEAYSLFKELRPSMEPYLPEATLTNLRNEVTNAYEELQQKKNKAEDYASKLKDLVWDKKVKEARQGFKENQKSLKQYLDAAAYADLEKTVMSGGSAKKSSAKAPAEKGK
jgi:hypothetical protein